MDAIKSSNSGKGDECHPNDRSRKSEAAQEPKVRIAVQKPTCRGNKRAETNTVNDLGPALKGYSSFLHLDEPECKSSSDRSIYGNTKKERQGFPPPPPHHTLSKHNTAIEQQKHILDYHKHPPPPDYQYEERVHCDVNFDKRNLRAQEHRHVNHQSELSQQCKSPGSCQQVLSKETSLKRQTKTCGLAPYVPKRLRKSNSDFSHDHQKPANQTKTENSDFYIVYPVIASQIDNARTSSRPPQHLFCNFVFHEGPVTQVQWNIPQFSHLLLSSSMDKTLRVWDYSIQRRCMQTLKCHEGAVKGAQWSADGQQILSCGFDKTARLTDVRSGTNFQVFEHSSYVTCIKWLPSDPQMFISGSYGSTIYCWDTRIGTIVHQYAGKLGQILDVEFINNGTEFVATCDTVSRDSTDRTIMVWDTKTAALLSNQLYHEKYTCCSVRAHPTDDVFMAQSNANYIALFSTSRPYRLNKYQRFEGHQVEGYRIGCDFSPDGSLVATGSADGKMCVYSYGSSKLIKRLGGGQQEGACTDVAWHPVMPGVIASSSWDGKVNVWT